MADEGRVSTDDVANLGPVEYELIYTLDRICVRESSSPNVTCTSTVRPSLYLLSTKIDVVAIFRFHPFPQSVRLRFDRRESGEADDVDLGF